MPEITMLETIFLFWFSILATAHCIILYIMCIWVQKLVGAVEKINGPRGQTSQPASFAADVPYIAKKDSYRVDQLPPEAIAPSIKNPPRPAGGFGTGVRKVDDNK